MRYFLLCLLTALGSYAYGKAQDSLIVMSWNVENLFDTKDNPDTEDDDFTPGGKQVWTTNRYYKKLRQVATGISRTGRWDWPTLVGLIEVENDTVLKDLLKLTPLEGVGYEYRLSHGKDRRGIGLALLYLADRFRPIYTHEYHITNPQDPNFRTRPILHVAGRLQNGDTLDVFLCHFPSRRSGAKATAPLRELAAQRLRIAIDSLANNRAACYTIIMGDFNGEPNETATAEILKAKPIEKFDAHDRHLLYNLSWHRQKESPPGTYLYRGVWSRLDQIIVSRDLLQETGLRYKPNSARIEAFEGSTKQNRHAVGRIEPFRTYAGPFYQGGYSDHLPVRAVLLL